eukprot:3706872-Pyramimonas_sp.AAC.1
MPETVYGVVLANTKKISVVLTEEGHSSLPLGPQSCRDPWLPPRGSLARQPIKRLGVLSGAHRVVIVIDIRDYVVIKGP